MTRRLVLLFLLSFTLIQPINAIDLPKANLDALLTDFNAQEKNSQASSQSLEKQIATIKILGNRRIKDEVIRAKIKSRVTQKANKYLLKQDVKSIMSLGTFQNVTFETTDTSEGVEVVFTVQETPVIDKIEFIGLSQLQESDIKSVLKSKEGEAFNRKNLREDISRIQKIFETKGYAQAKVKRTILPQKEGEPLTFILSEGIIKNIVITGNNKTKDFVIRREMTIASGDILTNDALSENLRRIYNLNFFTALAPNLKENTDGTYDLVLDVTERENSGQFSFGGGYSPQSGFSIFSDLFWDNIFGSGQMVLLKGQFGLGGSNSASNSRFQFKYHNPWMWEGRKSFTSRVWSTDGQAVSALNTGSSNRFRDERRVGADFTVGLPINYESAFRHKLKFERVEIEDINRGYSVTSYTLGVHKDTRDVRFNPRDGYYVALDIENAFAFRSTALPFTRYDVSLRRFFPTYEKQTIALRLDLGYLTSPKINDEDLFGSEFYRVGFSDTVRGQDESEFSYGNKKLVSSAEYRFLFNDVFSLVFFLDAGFATNQTASSIDINEIIKVGKGVGVRFIIPGLGPLRIDAGNNQEGETRIQVNIGHAF